MSPGQPITIGRPDPNVHAYVVDSQLRPVPVGVPGELLLSGPRLGKGYVGRPDLTAAAHVPSPLYDSVRELVPRDMRRYYQTVYRTGEGRYRIASAGRLVGLPASLFCLPWGVQVVQPLPASCPCFAGGPVRLPIPCRMQPQQACHCYTHRRPGALAARWESGVSRPHRPPGLLQLDGTSVSVLHCIISCRSWRHLPTSKSCALLSPACMTTLRQCLCCVCQLYSPSARDWLTNGWLLPPAGQD